MKKIVDFIKRLNDTPKIIFCRLWFSGMICFLIVMGTTLGEKEDTFDLVFTLGAVMGIANLFVFNPIVYGMFDLERRGKIVNKKFTERTVLEGVIYMLGEVFKSMVAVLIVTYIYAGLNILINMIRNVPVETISFGVEPLGFAFFFTFVYVLMGYMWDLCVIIYEKIKSRGKEKTYDKKNME